MCWTIEYYSQEKWRKPSSNREAEKGGGGVKGYEHTLISFLEGLGGLDFFFFFHIE